LHDVVLELLIGDAWSLDGAGRYPAIGIRCGRRWLRRNWGRDRNGRATLVTITWLNRLCCLNGHLLLSPSRQSLSASLHQGGDATYARPKPQFGRSLYLSCWFVGSMREKIHVIGQTMVPPCYGRF
jgi:hypothetical protein